MEWVGIIELYLFIPILFRMYGAPQDIKVHLGAKIGEIEFVNYYQFANGSFPCCYDCDCSGLGFDYIRIIVCKNGPVKINSMTIPYHQGAVQVA